jgi:zinc transporter ZupT
MFRFFVVVGVLFAFANGAEARTSHHHLWHSAHHHLHYAHHHHGNFSRQHERHYARHVHRNYAVDDRPQSVAADSNSFSPSLVQQPTYERSAAPRHAHLGGRPRAWCGWYMRQLVGSDPGPQYNLARSWTNFGSNVGGPTIGAIVVWRHHVGKIVGRENGQWIVQSGNDGHAVRTRPRSLAGAIAFRSAYASM